MEETYKKSLRDSIYNQEYDDLGGAKVHRTAIIGDNVKLGDGTIVMPYAVIGEPGFNTRSPAKGKIIIGKNNLIGCHTCIMAGGETVIGDSNLIMNFVNIGHDCFIGSNVEIGVGTKIAGHVSILSDSRVRMGCVLRNRISVGFESVVGMGSVVVKDVPPRTTVMGHPAK